MPIRQTDPGAFAREHRDELLTAVTRVLDSGWYVLGGEVKAFEAEFAHLLGCPFAVGVGNGTDADALALRAVAITRGSRVATVSHTAVATVAAIEMTGATPVLIDIDPHTYTMDPEALAAELDGGEPIHAILVVHLYGQPADLTAISQLAARREIPVIEDCAQAHGARIGERCVGSIGAAAAFSFYPTKNLGAFGDGGMVTTHDAELAERVRALREYGWRSGRVSEIPGVNSRLDELQAGLLRVRLVHLAEGNARRAHIAAAYTRGLEGMGLTLPAAVAGTTHAYHQYVIRSVDRDGLQARLHDRGIGTLVHYPVPIHLQPAYRGRVPLGRSGLEVTERAAREVLSLPMYPELDDSAVAEIIDAVRAAV